MTINYAISNWAFEVVIENGEERFKSAYSCPTYTKKDIEFFTANRLAIIEEIKRQDKKDAERSQADKANRGYVASVSESKLQTINEAGEWVDASTIVYPTPEPKRWNGTSGDMETVKEMLKAWDTPEMKAKASVAAAYHDEIHGDDSDDYDDD
jgi:hypothetical protein